MHDVTKHLECSLGKDAQLELATTNCLNLYEIIVLQQTDQKVLGVFMMRINKKKIFKCQTSGSIRAA